MAFDGVTLHTIVNELQFLKNAKVNSIYEPSQNNIVISVYNKNTYAINIDTTANNYRIHLTTYNKQNPIVCPNFCMILRKYLSGGRINNIYMKGLERIAYIEFNCLNEMNDEVKRTLIIELMGKYSNIILVNENSIILDALKKFDSESDNIRDINSNNRSIMPGRKYVEVNDTKIDILSINKEKFVGIVLESDYKTLEKAIPSLFTGISKVLINSIITDLKLTNTVSKNNLEEIYDYLFCLINEDNNVNLKVLNEKDYSIVLDKENKDDLFLNFKLDDFYNDKYEKELFVNYRNSLLRLLGGTLDKLVKKMENIDQKILACEDMEKNKVFGELLIANIYRFKDIKEYENIKELEVENYYDNNNLVKIPIDVSLNIQKNADKYFKKYNKMKNTLRVTKKQKEQTDIELKYLETLVYELDNCKNIEEVDEVYNEMAENVLFIDLKNNKMNKRSYNKRKELRESKGKIDDSLNNYYKLEIDGFKVFVGKNNKQNDYLTTKVAKDRDLWFHTKDIHGSHLILKCDGEMPKNSTIIKCAEIAAFYSKARYSSHVPVDYTLIKNVKKPKGAVPGYVIYVSNKTVYVEPSNKNY